MIISMSKQVILFLSTVAIGFGMGFFYDWIRIFRRLVKHFKFIIQIEDFIYWICCCAFLFIAMLIQNNGEIRAFLILGCFLGMILYFCIISQLFLNVSMAIIRFIKKVILFVFKCVMLPIKIIAKFIIIPFKTFRAFLIKFLKNIKSLLKKSKIYAKIIKYKKSFKSIKSDWKCKSDGKKQRRQKTKQRQKK